MTLTKQKAKALDSRIKHVAKNARLPSDKRTPFFVLDCARLLGDVQKELNRLRELAGEAE